uniref:Lipid binding protein ag-50 n=1 Tax=Ascaridia galli TaxID=46685 RepID=Q2TTC2_9BILA|nr:lipid binding protein ag-50 [Ascaridia galli]
MKTLFVITVCVLISSTWARSLRTSREVHEDLHHIAKKKARSFAHVLSKLRDPMLYDNVTKLLEKSPEKMDIMMLRSLVEHEHDVHGKPAHPAHPVHLKRECHDVLIILSKILKKALSKGSHPTKEEMTNLAKELSAKIRAIHVDELINALFAGHSYLKDENIHALQEVAAAHVHSPDPHVNHFITALKDEKREVYKLAGWTKCVEQKFRENLQKPYKGEHPSPEAFLKCKQEWGSHLDVFPQHFAHDILENLRSEENAISLVNGFTEVCKALKQSSSYASWDTLIASLEKAPRSHARAVILRDIHRCLVKKRKPEVQEKIKKAMSAILGLLKVMLSEDEHSKHDIDAAIEEVEKAKPGADIYEETKKIISSMSFYSECIITPEDRKLFREVVDSAHGELADEAKLKEVKAKNEKLYYILFLINDHVAMLRRYNELSDPAEAFFHKTVTFPNALHLIQRYANTTEEYHHQADQVAEKLATDFHALAPDVKKELVKHFPFRSILLFSTLD